MAVAEITKLFSNQDGTSTSEKRTYRGVYQVRVTDPLDDQVIVLASLANVMGSSWSQAGFGRGLDSEAVCVKLDPKRVSDTRLLWTVDGSWETPDADQNNQRDNQGNPTDNPVNWRDEVEWQADKYQIPVQSAKILQALQGRPANTFGPVINAAGDVLDPPPEREESHSILRITRYAAEFPVEQEKKFKNVVNSAPFYVVKPGLIRTFLPYTAKIEPITGSLNWHRFNNGLEIFYWKTLYELHINERGWREFVVNRGRNRRAQPGDKDAHGRTISASDFQNKPHKPQLEAIKDADGIPLGVVLLDLNGQPLPPGTQATYIKYGFYDELDFTELDSVLRDV